MHKFHIERIKIMKIIKRIASVITATAISVCCMNFTQYSYEKNFSIESSAAELFFETIVEDDGTITLVKYTGTEEKVVIPRTIGERTVTTIGSCCFEDNLTIKEVILPDTIKTIDYKAFADCKNLETINFPYSVETIGRYAFTTCHSLKAIDLKNVKNLGECAFQLCISLEEIYVPGSVSLVVDHAFHGCHSVRTLTFGDGVKTIDSTAVLNSYSIERILIPKSVTNIGEYALGYTYYHPNYTRLGDVTFFVYNNTAGLEYAKNNGFTYEIIGEPASSSLLTLPPTVTFPAVTTTTTPIVTTPYYILGDVNQDDTVNSSDASLVLEEYSRLQTGNAASFSAIKKDAADVNRDSKIDSTDASKILEYYAAASTGKIPSWN